MCFVLLVHLREATTQAVRQPRDSSPHAQLQQPARWLVDCLSVKSEAAHLGSSIQGEGGSIRHECQQRVEEELSVGRIELHITGVGFGSEPGKCPP